MEPYITSERGEIQIKSNHTTTQRWRRGTESVVMTRTGLQSSVGATNGEGCSQEAKHKERLSGCLVLDIVGNGVREEELDLRKDLQTTLQITTGSG